MVQIGKRNRACGEKNNYNANDMYRSFPVWVLITAEDRLVKKVRLEITSFTSP